MDFTGERKLPLCMLISCQEKESNKCGFENRLISCLLIAGKEKRSTNP